MNMELPSQKNSRLAQETSEGGHGARNAVIGIVVIVAALGGFYWWTHRAPDGGRLRNVAAPVKVGVAEKRDMLVIERTLGTVIANSSVAVTARVQGQLNTAYFKEGQMVKKGDLLFQIDPAPYQAVYDSAAATLLGAKSTADRDAALLKQNAIAPMTNDSAQAAYLTAKANVEAARLNLEFTKIRSPVTGKTGPMLLQPGNLVSVNGITTPLVTISEIQPIKVSFALPQADLPRIQTRAKTKGLTAQIVLHDVGGEDVSGPVDFISNTVNATSGTIELRSTFANADLALVPGQLVDVVVELADIPNATVVPREAVNNGQDGQFVFVVTPDGTAESRDVKLLFDDGTNDAVEGNLKEGDHVIVDGQLRVIPGGKVTVTRGGPAGGTAAPRKRGGKGKRASAAE